MGKLKNDKHELFCREYIINFNASKAYEKIFKVQNNSARTNAGKLLAKADISQRVAELVKPACEKAELTVQGVLKDIAEIKKRCMQGEPVKEFNHETKQMEETGEWQFKEGGALKASELEGRYLAMWNDKLKVGIEEETLEKLIHRKKNAR